MPLGSFGQSITVDAGNPTYTGQSVTFTLEPPCGTVTQISWNTNGGSINWQSGSSVSISWASVGNKNVSVSFTYVCENVSYYSSASTSIEIAQYIPPPPPPCYLEPFASFGNYHNGEVYPFVNTFNLCPDANYLVTVYFTDGSSEIYMISGAAGQTHTQEGFSKQIASVSIMKI